MVTNLVHEFQFPLNSTLFSVYALAVVYCLDIHSNFLYPLFEYVVIGFESIVSNESKSKYIYNHHH